MTHSRRPGNRNHLDRLIDDWSKQPDAAPAGRLRRLVCVSVLATMLDGLRQDGRLRLAFKGGASLEMRFGIAARASRDVDAITNVTLDEAFEEIGVRLGQEWSGFTGTVGDRTDITRAGLVPPPQRCRIKLSYMGKPIGTLPFELGRAEAGSFDLVEVIENVVDLAQVQLDGGLVPVLNVHYQIAQKLHACTEVPAEGENPRVHDLYDILLLAPLAEEAGLSLTKAACLDTFDHRAKHSFPPTLPEWGSWPEVWANLGVPDHARWPYEHARVEVVGLIDRISNA